MDTSENAKEMLRRFRKAAQAKETYECELTLRELNKLIDGQTALQTCNEYLRRFLPEVEKYHPDIVWIYEWLNMTAQLNTSSYRSIESKLAEEKISQPYPDNALEAIRDYLRTALTELDRLYQYYFEGHKRLYSYGFAAYFAWLFRSQTAIYQHVNCPEAFTGYMRVLNLEHALGNNFSSQFSHAELEEFATLQQACRSCKEETPHTFWLELADEIERRLPAQTETEN
jgi:hypothetical protein